ncbi:unnamed protein product [Sphagnum troendelagicum]|uniref:Uncharacterized protein n=1 Tax=Sphagnum troendelagicum TaxID=128251 RepID=A0ABP0V4Z3_9BRYO
MCPYAVDRISLTTSSSGSSCSRISANRVFCWRPLVQAPFSRFLSFASFPWHWRTLLVAASSHPGQSESWFGRGWEPSQASRKASLFASSLSKEVSNYVVDLGGADVRPQIVITSGE